MPLYNIHNPAKAEYERKIILFFQIKSRIPFLKLLLNIVYRHYRNIPFDPKEPE